MNGADFRARLKTCAGERRIWKRSRGNTRWIRSGWWRRGIRRGGHLALWLANQGAVPLRGVVPLAPVADLRRAWELKLSSNVTEDFLGGSPEKVPERYRAASPVELVPLGVRQRVFHGDRDDVVPPAMSRAYVAAARKSGDDCTLTEPEGVGHFELIDPRTAAWGQVLGAIEKLLE